MQIRCCCCLLIAAPQTGLYYKVLGSLCCLRSCPSSCWLRKCLDSCSFLLFFFSSPGPPHLASQEGRRNQPTGHNQVAISPLYPTKTIERFFTDSTKAQQNSPKICQILLTTHLFLLFSFHSYAQCNAGSYQPSGRDTSCPACLAGKYTGFPSQQACLECIPGRFAPLQVAQRSLTRSLTHPLSRMTH